MKRQNLTIHLTEPKQPSGVAHRLIEQYKTMLSRLDHHLFTNVTKVNVMVVISKNGRESLFFEITNLSAGEQIKVELSLLTNTFRITGTTRFNHCLEHKNTVEKLCFLTEQIGGINHA